MFRRLFALALVVVAPVSLSGCCSPWHRDATCAPPSPCDRCGPPVALPARAVVAPGPVAVPAGPPPGSVYAPPQATPVAPGAVYLPPSAPAVPAAPPTAVVQGSYNAPPLAQSVPQTQEPTVRLAPPELSTPGPAQSREPPKVSELPPAAQPKEPSQASPIDIPQFAVVRTNVATGLQPFPDGVAWLKDHSYRVVLHVRPAGTDDTAARRQFEKYGLRYLAIDVDAQTLSKETVDQFNRLVGDEANLPLFVYDKDASLTGGLWYLHFRLVEGLSDEKARAEASRLGFRQETDDNHRTMWVAVQKLLEANGR
jgi:protein tyrosine phosphatase (PTP) superfamily phosphohydrolase (DUF442 family)